MSTIGNTIDAVSGVLLASDLDGTLAVGGRIGADDRRAAGRLKRAGIPLLIITGRNPRSLEKVEGLWELADEVIFGSGAGVLRHAKKPPEELHRLSGSEVLEICAILDEFGEDYCILDPIPKSHHFAWRRHRAREENSDFDSRMALYSDWARSIEGLVSDEPIRFSGACQVLVIRPPHAKGGAELSAALGRWSVFSSSSPIDHESLWLEVFPHGVHKGAALAEWCRERHFEASRVICLGNDHNDVPMLAWAGHPWVVGNAPEPLRGRFPVLPPAGAGGFEAAVEAALDLADGSS